MRRRGAGAVALVGVLAAACGGGSAPGREAGVITVLAAASLTDAFTSLGEAYAASVPGAVVEFDFGSSSGLARQIVDGAPADVFASADHDAMAMVTDAGAAAGPPRVVAGNVMEIAVPPGNPAAVSAVGDLALDDLLVGLCAEEVPCGRLARRLLADNGVVAAIDTNEPDVRSLLTKIEAAELDAGVVYHSDVVAAGERVEALPVPGAERRPASYPVVVLAAAAAPEEAAAFVDFVLSDPGQAILAAAGFLPGPGEDPRAVPGR